MEGRVAFEAHVKKYVPAAENDSAHESHVWNDCHSETSDLGTGVLETKMSRKSINVPIGIAAWDPPSNQLPEIGHYISMTVS